MQDGATTHTANKVWDALHEKIGNSHFQEIPRGEAM